MDFAANISGMLDKLKKIEFRFEEVKEELLKPGVISNMKVYPQLTREYKELDRIVSKSKVYIQVLTDIEGAKEILTAEKDPEMRELAKAELTELEPRRLQLEEELKSLLIPKDREDSKNVILEIRAGTGGDEASLFAGDLFRMYNRFAEKNGWKVELNSFVDGTAGGYKEIIATIRGEDAFGTMKYESGVHRVQRVPQTETQGRIHTSAATVACMPEMEDFEVDLKDSEIKIDRFCSSGPGGQSVNTTYSAVRLTHIPSGIVVSMQDEKSQIKNLDKAMRILKSRIYDIEMQKRLDVQSKLRKTFVSTGDRSAKIRTYNFPQGRVTDHRIGLTLYNLGVFLDGEIGGVIEQLRMAENAEKLKVGG